MNPNLFSPVPPEKTPVQYYCSPPDPEFILFPSELPSPMDDCKQVRPTQEEIDDESRRIRRLRILVHLTIDTIASGDLSAEEAAGMVAATRRVALEMFPGKENAFDLLYRPKFQRITHAVYRLQ